MATVFYYGLQTAKQKRITLTIGYSAGATYTLTVNGKDVAFTATTDTNTASLVASAVALAAGNMNLSNFSECFFSSNGALVIVDGPLDGGTLTASGAASAGTFATTSTGTQTSPNDLGDTANYSTAALPANNDTLIFPKGCPDVRYNLNALAAKTGLVIVREFGGGKIGLPDFRTNGQAEWRAVRCTPGSAASLALNVSETAAQSIRFDMAATATVVTVLGASQSAIGAEVVEVVGLTTGATASVTGCSLALGTKDGGTDIITSVAANGSTLTVGRYCSPVAISVNGGLASIAASWSDKLTVDQNANVSVIGSAGGQPIVESGTVYWNGNGTLTSPQIGSGGSLNLDSGVGSVALAGTNQVVTVTSGAAATGGTATFRVPQANGTMVTTGAVTWNATDATLIANVQAAVDTATGVAGGIVVSGAAPDTALTFTMSGTGFTGNQYPLVQAVTWFTSWSAVVSAQSGSDAKKKQVTRQADDAQFIDNGKRLTRPFRLVNDHCTMDGTTVQIGTHNLLDVDTAA